MSNNQKLLIAVAVAIAVFFLIDRFNRQETIQQLSGIKDNYGKEWMNPIDHSKFVEISRILVANKIGDCGELYIKDNKGEPNLFAIACTGNGKNFKYYIVNTATQDLIATTNNGSKPN